VPAFLAQAPPSNQTHNQEKRLVMALRLSPARRRMAMADALMHGCERADIDIVAVMLELKADPQAVASNGLLPTQAATYTSHYHRPNSVGVLLQLLAAKADAQRTFATAVQEALPKPDSYPEADTTMLELLLEHKAVVDNDCTVSICRPRYTSRPLACALMSGDISMVKLLVKHGARLTEDELCRSSDLLFSVARHDNFDSSLANMQYLLKLKANVHVAQPNGALVRVVRAANKLSNMSDTVKIAHYNRVASLLLRAKASPTAPGLQTRRTNPLALAINNVALVAQLLRAKADPTVTLSDKRTTLLHMPHLLPAVVRLLLEAKADANARERDGTTPMDKTHRQDVMAVLRAHGAEN
jgi:ankyrin repeat protein